MSFLVVFVIYQEYIGIINAIFGCFYYLISRFKIDLLFILPTLFCIDETFYLVGRFKIDLLFISTNLYK